MPGFLKAVAMDHGSAAVTQITEDFEAGNHPELASELRALAARYLRAAEK